MDKELIVFLVDSRKHREMANAVAEGVNGSRKRSSGG